MRILGCSDERAAAFSQLVFRALAKGYVAVVTFRAPHPKKPEGLTCFEMVGVYTGSSNFTTGAAFPWMTPSPSASVGRLWEFNVRQWAVISNRGRSNWRETYPVPTPTAVPSATPSPQPTATPAPTPTAIPAPTATQTPTPTPTATATPTRRPTRTPTPTPESRQWEPVGNWSQDLVYESSLNATLKSEGYDSQAKVATLDAVATAWMADLSLSLGCIDGLGVVYLTPYSWEVPPSADTYVVGLWNDETDDWVEDAVGWYRNPVVTDDGSAIYVTNQSQVRQIIRILERANQNRNPDVVLNVGMFDSENDDVLGLWGDFDPTGLRAALQYLPCL